MLEWAAPVVLILLAPVAWWLRRLHRRRGVEAEIVVPSLFPWPASDDGDDTSWRDRDPDPRWWRRAAIAALLLIAAAGPLLARRERPRIEVFLDDRPSLGARDEGKRRLDVAVARLVPALRAVDPAEIRVVSLGRPTEVLTLAAAAPETWAARIIGWTRLRTRESPLPPAARLHPDLVNWIVTDGADPDVATWAAAAPMARAIHVGSATENVGVTLVAARPHVEHADRLRAVVQVTNAGADEARRDLTIAAGGATLLTETMTIPPATTVERTVDVGADRTARLRAALSPADVLPDDDTLELTEAVSPKLRVRLDPRCGPHVARAIRVHPALSDDAAADALTVSCSAGGDAWGTGPLLWFRPPLAAGDGSVPVVVAAFDDRRRRLEVHRDMETGGWVDTPEYAAYVAELVDVVAGRPLLDRITRIERPRRDVAIAPRAPALRDQRPAVPAKTARADVSAAVLVLAIVLIAVDAALLRRP